MELVTETQLKTLALTNDGCDFPTEGGRAKSGALKRLKNMLGIPEYYYSGEYCPRCGGYMWWDGTCAGECDVDLER